MAAGWHLIHARVHRDQRTRREDDDYFEDRQTSDLLFGELAGRLVRHDGKLKVVIDVICVVCANAESDLAALLAPHMRRPREAKKLVANILAAPGNVAVTDDAIHIRIAPAANRSERQAIQHLCTAINERGLSLPGDPKRLPLRFSLQLL